MNNTNDYINEKELIYYMVEKPNFIKKATLNPKFFHSPWKEMYSSLLMQYKKYKTFAMEDILKTAGFNYETYFDEITKKELFIDKLDTNEKMQLKADLLQTNILEIYKKEQEAKLVEEYKNGKIKNLEKKLNELSKLSYTFKSEINVDYVMNLLKTKNNKLKTNYHGLDSFVKISQQDLVILAGGTGTGKTTFAINLLRNLSENYKCIYFNMEMSESVLWKKIISSSLGIPYKNIEDYDNLTNKQKEDIENIVKEMKKRDITLFNKRFSIDDIKKSISQIRTDKHIVIIIDHIGLINEKETKLYERMTKIAKEIRTICLDYDCTVFALCQLSRKAQEEAREPRLQDLRDSGEIEQSARKVLMLYNPEKDTSKLVNGIKLIITKNDTGMLGDIPFRFEKDIQRFSEDYTKYMK